jgi:hypothetical protein
VVPVVTVSVAEEAERDALYDRDSEQCNFTRSIFQDPATYAGMVAVFFYLALSV